MYSKCSLIDSPTTNKPDIHCYIPLSYFLWHAGCAALQFHHRYSNPAKRDCMHLVVLILGKYLMFIRSFHDFTEKSFKLSLY